MFYSKNELETSQIGKKKTRHCAADDWPYGQLE